MRNKKALAAGALMVPALALTGGIAYASSTGSHPAPTRPAVTTVQAHGKHPTGQARHDRCDWRCGDHQGDRRGHGYERHATQRPVTQPQATESQATQHHAYRHRSHRTSAGYQGGWGYQGSGQDGGHGYRGPHGGGGRHGGRGCW